MLWDFWVTREAKAKKIADDAEAAAEGEDGSSASSATSAGALALKDAETPGLNLSLSSSTNALRPAFSPSSSAIPGHLNASVSGHVGHPTGASTFASYSDIPPYGDEYSLSPRNQQRIATVKSAILIYCAVLGLSPILKSLTKSTTSDSIWAMSSWLMLINVAFFDYGGGVGAK
jgi:phosphatidylinositol glycan class C protein